MQLHHAQKIWQEISEKVDEAGYLTDENEAVFDDLDNDFKRLCDLIDRGFEPQDE